MGKVIEIKLPQQTIERLYNTTPDYKRDIWSPLNADAFHIIHISKGDNLSHFFPDTENTSSSIDGYIVYNQCHIRRGKTKEEAKKIIIGVICEKIDDAFQRAFGYINCKRIKDSYTNKESIIVNKDDNCLFYGDKDILFQEDLENFSWMSIGRILLLRFEFSDSQAFISFSSIYEKQLHEGDTISLLLDNGTILDYTLTRKPLAKYWFKFTLYQEDIDAILANNIISYRITYSDESELPLESVFENHFFGDYVHDAVRYYLQYYLNVVHNLIPEYTFPFRKIKRGHNGHTFNWCYVYLMKDISNGYYKIGISNTPEYRERTLQSEKPTIEMLACKKFPTRKIAEAIESALHTAYSKQRLRGEWFNLNEADVAAIIETLK